MPQRGWVSTGHHIIALIIILFLSVFTGGFAHMLFTLKEMNTKLLQISNTDKLTGCLNRRAYEDDLIRYTKSGTNNDFVYVAIDVNGLKNANDTLGHAAGDELICGLAACMMKCFQPFGKVYRIGGDEFVALLFADTQQLERIKLNLNETVGCWKGKYLEELTISAGYVQQCEFPNESVLNLAKIADKRMYNIKREYYQKIGNDRRGR
ncbi:MAG: GGDEF domain-containing protein [Spirochaetaceae bacterium]|nr:GGDEF domain-containing protein [Spirochaetaceae bacterium]